MDSWQGECVEFKECLFERSFGGFVSSEDIIEIKKRSAACNCSGKNLFCCEISNIKPATSIEVTIPPQTTASNIVPTTVSSQNDPLLHSNYKLFKDLKCGSTFSNRVAHGELFNLSL